jgi:cell division septum initiation protein DivIVA
VYNAVQHKEVIAKAEIGNSAAHGRFHQYKKEDVAAFIEFVLRFLAQYLR